MRLRVGLTGGIGSGKSTVSAMLRERGAIVIDYDQLARDAVTPGSPGLAAISQRFGPHLVASDGTLDRAALAAIVFASPDELRALEAITHPAIKDLAQQAEKLAAGHDIVVHDNPLLIEMGGHEQCDVVVVVDVSREVQLQRLVELRGMSPQDAEARIAAQTTSTSRTAVADLVIDNNGTPQDLAVEVQRVWSRLTAWPSSTA